ncbi:hypothetical protein SAMN04488038_102297 [Solimonas aquatica]|uniref:Uncharacterized protein n=1 Tax=Solimonas aquatica TaxID=489703 RepID=A0A1H9BZK3_9GAMM|nr:hypothetical protein [Solimonas aquatica]SEP94455.1 hypothetical protein SAMN04488038_102297 [Solimonas aquatica]
MNEDRDEDRLPALRGLRLDAEPQCDLWPEIAMRLPSRRRQGLRAGLGLAMAAGLTLALGLGFLPVAQRQPEGSLPAQTLIVSPGTTAPLAGAPVLGQSRALIKANLQIARSSRQQLRQALQQDPDAEFLQRLLQRTEEHDAQLHELLREAS